MEAMKTKVEDTLYATMDASVANLIIEGRLRTEKRNVAVMFSDLSGFTNYSEERPPELVIRDLNRYLGDIEPIIMAYRGHIDKYMGDGTMCEFGAPLDSEAYRIQAVLAAIKLQERVAAGDYPWTMRIGIASGLAITGLIGSKRQTYTAIGDVVNLASRLEKLAAPGRILIDRYTYEDVARFVEAEKRRDLPLREIRDAERERQLEALHEQMTGGATDAERFYRIGQLHQELNEPVEALQYFERALRLDPNHVHFKVAYAEARMRLDINGTISIKGKRKRVEAFEVVGLRNPLADREKIPEGFYNEYRHCAERIQVPADLILPIEARDARIGHSTTVAVIAYAIADVLGIAGRRAHGHPARRIPGRHRHGDRAAPPPQPARLARRHGVRGGQEAPHGERAAAADHGLSERARAGDHPRQPRAARRLRLPGAAARRRHPARRPHRGRRRRLRRADVLAPVPRPARPRRRTRRDPAQLHPRHLRSAGRRSAPETARP